MKITHELVDPRAIPYWYDLLQFLGDIYPEQSAHIIPIEQENPSDPIYRLIVPHDCLGGIMEAASQQWGWPGGDWSTLDITMDKSTVEIDPVVQTEQRKALVERWKNIMAQMDKLGFSEKMMEQSKHTLDNLQKRINQENEN